MVTTAFNQDLSKWQIPSLQEAYAMFTGSRLSTVNYDKMLISWSQQSVQPDVYFDGAALYCSSAEAQNILTSPPNNWVINNFMSGNEYHCAEPVITGVDFSQENDKKILTVTGENLLYGVNDKYWVSEGPMFFAAYGGNFVHINGQSYDVCAENSGLTAAEWKAKDAHFVSDSAPCFYLQGPGGDTEPLISDTQFKIVLASDFDTTAPGTVVVFDAPEFTFNQTQEGSGTGESTPPANAPDGVGGNTGIITPDAPAVEPTKNSDLLLSAPNTGLAKAVKDSVTAPWAILFGVISIGVIIGVGLVTFRIKNKTIIDF